MSTEIQPLHLILPEADDDLPTLLPKLTLLADIISTGHSVAAATNYQATPTPERDAAKAAVAQMPPTEHDFWKAYLQGSIQLPEIDWKANQESAPTAKNSLKVACRRAEALNRLYGTDEARPSHSVWFTKNNTELIPLLKAMARVIGMERNLAGGHCRADESRLAELQTIRKIISCSSQIHRRHETAPKAARQIINSKLQILINHQRELQKLITGSQKRKGVPFPEKDSPASKAICTEQSELS